MEQVRVTAKNYDEAVTNALLQLHTTSDNIDIKVIEEGTGGLFGVLGGKPWTIEVTKKSECECPTEEKNEVKKEEAPLEIKKAEEVKAEKKAEPKHQKKETAAAKESSEKKEIKKDEIKKEEIADTPEAEAKEALKPVSEEEAKELIAKAEKFLDDVFSKMDIAVTKEASFDHSCNELSVILSGEDMGMLIGKRGQTLDSLQYLASLVVNKHHDGYIRVKLDTENYRERRQEKLEELAHNIAAKVKKNKKRVELEPMNPYERRVIHSALQSDPLVTTISEGEEPYRHIVVLLKKEPKGRYRRK